MGWVSGQAYSEDLRARVVSAVDRGGRVYEIAPLFEVSVSYIYKALARRRLHGIETTLPLFRKLVRTQDIIDGNYHIHWLERFLAEGGMEP